MRPDTFVDRIFSFISKVFGTSAKTQRIVVLEDGKKRDEFVPNPVTFSELDEMFGKGNWAIPSKY